MTPIPITCLRIGGGLGGGVQKIWAKVWGAYNSNEIKWGGLEAGIAGGYLIFGGSYSGSGGIDKGSSTVGVGLGVEMAGYLYSHCMVIL